MKKSSGHKILLGSIALCVIGIIIWLFRSPESFSWLLSNIKGAGHLPVKIIEFLNYPGILILMAMESMIFPLPSELVMPFAGFLVAEGKMDLTLVILFSSLGSLFGSLISYAMGFYGGHRFVVKFGKYFLLDTVDLEKTANWFRHQGEKTIFISRFVPVVRHLISIPAGIGKMDLKTFSLYTILGATMWNGFLTWCGLVLGKNWEMVRHYSEYFSIGTAIVLVLAGIVIVRHHIQNKRGDKRRD